MIGFFSETAAAKLGRVAVYLNDIGDEVQITAVYDKEENGNNLYKPIYADAVCVGKINQFQRHETVV